ncbi:MAG: hypothetical protein IT377_03745 [Polyangiaceae bacterium]|nr:hypothetical protein [Polyangiaceae bacterium]
MGLFDRFTRKPTAPPPPMGPLVALPASATIASFDVTDAVGTLKVDAATTLRFGRSACRDFEPVVGAKVIVRETEPSRFGPRATRLELDPTDADYDQLLRKRDSQAGIHPEEKPEEAAAAARALGWITVLLDRPVPQGPQAQRVWAGELGLADPGVEVHTEARLAFRVLGTDVLTHVGDRALSPESLDLRDVGEDFDLGQGFVALGLGEPGLFRASRATGGVGDLWGPKGALRALSKLAALLLRHGRGVVLHRAGNLVVDGREFLRQLGDLDDPECVPFTAWLDFTIEGAPPVYRSWGMAAFALPDVQVAVNPDDAWDRSRRHEAVLSACARMVRDNRELESGEELAVPIGVRVGAYPVAAVQGDVERYAAAVAEGGIELTPVGVAVDPAERWALASAPDTRDPQLIAPNTYRALFSSRFALAYPSDVVADVPCTAEGVVPHSIEVRRPRSDPGFVILTAGLGRIAQAGGDAAGFPHVELAAWVDEHSFELLTWVGRLARTLHERGPSAKPWKVGDTLRAPIAELGIGGFVLAEGGFVVMPKGQPVTVLSLVPLSPAEYDEAAGAGTAWLERHWHDPEVRSRVRARWKKPS